MHNNQHPPVIFVQPDDVIQILKSEAIDLKKGAVILVRSNYKHEVYGDHFSIIVGGKILKQRGLRPNLITLPTHQWFDGLFSKYDAIDGAIILKLKPPIAQTVMESYGIHLSEGELISI